METTKRLRFISIIIIFLLIINLAGLGTLLYHKWSIPGHKKFCCKEQVGKNIQDKNVNAPCFDDFLKKDLNLKKEQIDKFLELKKQFHEVAQKYMDSIDLEKNAMFEELKKDNPDFKKLKAISEKSGMLFTELKFKTTEHFLNIKSIFTKDQQAKYFGFVEKNSCCNMGQNKMNCPEGKNMSCPEHKDMNCPEHKNMNCPEHRNLNCTEKK